jgi:hypothetical protein
MAKKRFFRICILLAMYPTVAYSRSEAKTMTKHVPRYTSMDLTYDIFGSAALVDDMSVVMVNTVVTPNETRAGVAHLFSQKLTHDIMTINPLGMYIWIR